MQITLLQEAPGPARLADWFWAGDVPDRGLWEVRGASQRLSRSQVRAGTPAVRTLEHWSLTGPTALDRIEFVVSEASFAETARYLRRDGPNQHLRSIELPAILALHVWHHPIAGSAAQVRLGWIGRVRLSLPGQEPVEVEAIRLEGQEQGQQVFQWLARGIGEFAWGHGEQLDRWLIGWTGGEQTLFGGCPEALLKLTLPPLPDGPTPEPPKASVL